MNTFRSATFAARTFQAKTFRGFDVAVPFFPWIRLVVHARTVSQDVC